MLGLSHGGKGVVSRDPCRIPSGACRLSWWDNLNFYILSLGEVFANVQGYKLGLFNLLLPLRLCSIV